ncbi:DDE-type integrase/transposase/recombinase [Rhodococcus sp. KBS0724]|nr:DDE-type integrase/transposase/recombinase [Rhodococcus sp. KBS0724]TSD40561.1 DDE-type integrase/transposase/recombinase [Rhodococcus sp. KBS0724]
MKPPPRAISWTASSPATSRTSCGSRISPNIPPAKVKYIALLPKDTFSRRVVGWSIDSSQTATLVTNALGMAISNRGPTPGTLIHSDHGVQFTSWAFTRRAHDSGLVPSMGSIGDCYDCQSVPAGLCA